MAYNLPENQGWVDPVPGHEATTNANGAPGSPWHAPFIALASRTKYLNDTKANKAAFGAHQLTLDSGEFDLDGSSSTIYSLSALHALIGTAAVDRKLLLSAHLRVRGTSSSNLPIWGRFHLSMSVPGYNVALVPIGPASEAIVAPGSTYVQDTGSGPGFIYVTKETTITVAGYAEIEAGAQISGAQIWGSDPGEGNASYLSWLSALPKASISGVLHAITLPA